MWPNPQETADLVTFTEEIINGKLHFCAVILQSIRPTAHSVYNCHNTKRIKFATRLWLGLNHLRGYKFNHSLEDSINPLCNCRHNIESTTHSFLHCSLYINKRRTLLGTLTNLNCSLLDNTGSVPTLTLYFGNTSFTSNRNLEILIASINYALSTKKFDKVLF